MSLTVPLVSFFPLFQYGFCFIWCIFFVQRSNSFCVYCWIVLVLRTLNTKSCWRRSFLLSFFAGWENNIDWNFNEVWFFFNISYTLCLIVSINEDHNLGIKRLLSMSEDPIFVISCLLICEIVRNKVFNQASCVIKYRCSFFKFLWSLGASAAEWSK